MLQGSNSAEPKRRSAGRHTFFPARRACAMSALNSATAPNIRDVNLPACQLRADHGLLGTYNCTDHNFRIADKPATDLNQFRRDDRPPDFLGISQVFVDH
jgi:hypothetical protein